MKKTDISYDENFDAVDVDDDEELDEEELDEEELDEEELDEEELDEEELDEEELDDYIYAMIAREHFCDMCPHAGICSGDEEDCESFYPGGGRNDDDELWGDAFDDAMEK